MLWLLALLGLAGAGHGHELPRQADGGAPRDHIVARAYLVDAGGQASFEQVRERTFIPYQGTFNRGYTDAAHWIRLSLAASDSPLVLRLTPAWVDDITVFDPAAPGPRTVGDRHPVSASDHAALGFSLDLPASAQPRDIRLRLQTASAAQQQALAAVVPPAPSVAVPTAPTPPQPLLTQAPPAAPAAAPAPAPVAPSAAPAATPAAGTTAAAAPATASSTAAPAAAEGGASSTGGATTATGSANTSGITVDLRSAPTTETSVMAAVSLPRGFATSGTGFTFELPESIKTLAASQAATPQATRPDGSPLPSWLRFDAATLKFEAAAVPDGAFPMQLLMNVGGQRVLVVISERSE